MPRQKGSFWSSAKWKGVSALATVVAALITVLSVVGLPWGSESSSPGSTPQESTPVQQPVPSVSPVGGSVEQGAPTTGVYPLPGETTLRVKVLQPDGTPVTGLEVDLWTATSSTGVPDVGMATTDIYGIASFRVPADSYQIGFNYINFPLGKFAYPQVKTSVNVEGDAPTEATIQLRNK